jgi:hypothetical protein
MAGSGTRLTPSGVGGLFGRTAAAAGAIAASVSFAGAAVPAGTGAGSILARGIFTGAGGSIVSAVGSITSTVRFASARQRSRLLPHAVGGRFLPTPSKTAVTQKNWAVVETLGLNIAIADFDARYFYLVDTLGLALSANAVFRQSNGALSSTVTFTGIGKSVYAAVGLCNSVTTFSAAGAGLITNSGAGSISSAVTFAGQGATLGSVFGVGVGSISSNVSFSAVGASTAQTSGFSQSQVSFTGQGTSTSPAVGSMSASVTFNGFSTIFAPAVGTISGSVSLLGVSAAQARSVGLMPVTVTFDGRSGSGVGQLVGRMQFTSEAPAIQIESSDPTIQISEAA